MAELARLITHNQGRVNIHVLFYRPLDKPREWVESDLWQLAIKLPDVAVSTVSELDLLRFGVAASGQTLLYDTEGTLVFSGGITSARGHEGDNAGRSAISTYLHGGQIPLTQTPVFGCSIIDAESALLALRLFLPIHFPFPALRHIAKILATVISCGPFLILYFNPKMR